MRHLVNKVKQEEHGPETLSTFSKVHSFEPGPGELALSGKGEEAHGVGD